MFNKDELNQLYRYALSLGQAEDVAYDLLQASLERFLKKHKSSQNQSSLENPMAYIKTIIRNLYFDQQRHLKVVPMVSIEDEAGESFDMEDEFEQLLINQQEMEPLLAMLSAEENELLYLWAVEEYTADEIATIYQQPRGTVLSKLHRLKQRIRKHACTCEINIRGLANE